MLPWPCLLLLAGIKASDKIHSSIYRGIDYYENVNKRTQNSFNPCIAMSIGEKRIGCQSKHNGNIGILTVLKNATDVKILAKTGLSLLVPAVLFTEDLLAEIETQKIILEGVIVDDSSVDDTSNEKPAEFSSGLKCPSSKKGMYGENYGKDYANCESGPVWNKPGFSEHKFYDYPIFRVKNSTIIKNLRDCHDLTKSENSAPKCAVQMKAAQYVTKATTECLERKSGAAYFQMQQTSRCSPLQGVSTFTLLKKTSHNNVADENLKSLWITTALDGKSMFYEYAPTASRSMSLVLFLSIAEALGNAKNDWIGKLNKQIIFAGFDGEHYRAVLLIFPI